MAGVGQTSSGIRHWYQAVKGNSNGIPVAYMAANMEPGTSYQGQTDVFLRATNVTVCGNDYTASARQTIRNLFAPPNSVPGGDPRPVFVAINCVSNSPSHPQWQVLLREFYDGGGAIDFSPRIAAWRSIIDSVQAPPPRLTNVIHSGGTFQFTFPGQRGRTNRVESTTNLLDWTTVTNVFGTNAPVTYRDINTLPTDRRFYRILRF